MGDEDKTGGAMPEKYQEEIEEILKRAEETAPLSPARGAEKRARDLPRLSPGADRTTPQSSNANSRWPSLSAGKIALVGLILLTVGLWKTVFLWVGLGLLVLAYLLFFVQPRSVSHEKRWRGRALERRPSPWQRLLRWLRS
jgi:uncharacterized membrane protein